jgi:hypothetical protein
MRVLPKKHSTGAPWCAAPAPRNEQHKGARLRKLVSKLLLPEAAGTHGLGRKENARLGLAALQRVLHACANAKSCEV